MSKTNKIVLIESLNKKHIFELVFFDSPINFNLNGNFYKFSSTPRKFTGD